MWTLLQPTAMIFSQHETECVCVVCSGEWYDNMQLWVNVQSFIGIVLKDWEAGQLNPVQSHPYYVFREIPHTNPIHIFLTD